MSDGLMVGVKFLSQLQHEIQRYRVHVADPNIVGTRL